MYSSASSKAQLRHQDGKNERRRQSSFDDPKYRSPKQLKKQRRQDIHNRFSELSASGNTHSKTKNKLNQGEDANELLYKTYGSSCHMTFIFDPNGRFSYWMGIICIIYFVFVFHYISGFIHFQYFANVALVLSTSQFSVPFYARNSLLKPLEILIQTEINTIHFVQSI